MNLTLQSLNPDIILLLTLILLQAYLILKQDKKIKNTDKRLKILKSDLQALLLCSRGVGDKLNWQQREFKNLVERQDRLELTENGDPSYRQAIALMDRGASPDETVETCDLTEAEVELIAQLRRSRQTSNHVELVA